MVLGPLAREGPIREARLDGCHLDRIRRNTPNRGSLGEVAKWERYLHCGYTDKDGRSQSRSKDGV
jgi:hypothetical protein